MIVYVVCVKAGRSGPAVGGPPREDVPVEMPDAPSYDYDAAERKGRDEYARRHGMKPEEVYVFGTYGGQRAGGAQQ